MSNFTDAYEIVPQTTEGGLDFFFVSDGNREIVKIIRYSYVMNYLGTDVYNLAFGDFDRRRGSFSDDRVSR